MLAAGVGGRQAGAENCDIRNRPRRFGVHHYGVENLDDVGDQPSPLFLPFQEDGIRGMWGSGLWNAAISGTAQPKRPPNTCVSALTAEL